MIQHFIHTAIGTPNNISFKVIAKSSRCLLCSLSAVLFSAIGEVSFPSLMGLFWDLHCDSSQMRMLSYLQKQSGDDRVSPNHWSQLQWTGEMCSVVPCSQCYCCSCLISEIGMMIIFKQIYGQLSWIFWCLSSTCAQMLYWSRSLLWVCAYLYKDEVVMQSK